MIWGASWAGSTPWCRGVPSTTVGNVVIRAGLEDRLHVVEGDAGLLRDVLRHDGLRRRIERALPRDEEEAAALDALGDRRLGPLREAGLGRRLGEHDLWLHGRSSPMRRAAMPAGMGRAPSGPPGRSGRATQARTSKPVAQPRSPPDTSCSTRNVFSRTPPPPASIPPSPPQRPR